MATRRRFSRENPIRDDDLFVDDDLFEERPGNGAPRVAPPWEDESGEPTDGNGAPTAREPLGLRGNGGNGRSTDLPFDPEPPVKTPTRSAVERLRNLRLPRSRPRTRPDRQPRTQPRVQTDGLRALRDNGSRALRGLRDLGGDGLRALRGPRHGSEGPPLRRGPALPTPPGPRPPQGGKPRLKKLRVAIVLLGLALLAFVSWIFGIMMAVSQDLPQLENREQYKNAKNSVVYDSEGNKLATLTGNEHRILLTSPEISQTVKQAVVAIEDERFYEHRGIDFQGIGRAVLQDIAQQKAAQGASTITQQFVKNALKAQGSRTVFEKLREAALAYHLERRWSKDKILTEYMNSIYFGEGAYGVESAAETYFGWNHPGCGEQGNRCASQLYPEEAALLAGMISSPSAYSPRAFPPAAKERRNLVLQKMVDQGTLSQDEYNVAAAKPLPKPNQINPPDENSEAPYFTSWLKQQLVDRYGAGEAFGGGLRVKTPLNLELQNAAQDDVFGRVAPLGLSGSAVVIDNKTEGVLAMVGGSDFESKPFNLATNGHRQPGSSFKPFTLVTALAQGHSSGESFTSQPKTFRFHVPGYKAPQLFEVNNYEDQYYGSNTIASATTVSDNSVYAELGLQLGTDSIARTAQAMGIQTKVSTNPAMILGGLEEGVTPLEMAYSYSTLARHGLRGGGSMDSIPGPELGPVGIEQVTDQSGGLVKDETGSSGRNELRTKQAVPQPIADEATGILQTVISEGTGKNAAVSGVTAWGKTGTTENNGDAWFCGATEKITACVWVGHDDSNQPMETEYNGGPVDGGTIPAELWASIVSDYMSIVGNGGGEETSTATSTAAPAPAPAPATTAAPSTPAPAPTPAAPAPAAPPAGAGAGGAAGGAGGATP
jgi:penicillin-binding protein 1A